MEHADRRSATRERPSALRADDAELAVIAAMLGEPAFAVPIAVDLLAATEFAVPRHAALFRAMERLWNSDTAIDPITVTDSVVHDVAAIALFDGERGVVQDYVGWLLDAVPTAANVRHHA